VSVDSNAVTGLITGTNCRLSACSATSNSPGFQLASGCTITSSTANNNRSTGLITADSCTIIGCTANSNFARGIDAGSGCVVKDCTVSSNRTIGIKSVAGALISDCVVNGNGTTASTDGGIFAGSFGLVKHCTTYNNVGSGINVTGGSVVLQNESIFNSGDGITATGSVNRIDGNHCLSNTGIGINAGNDWVVRNTGGSNTGGNIVGAGADIGPSETANTATHPFANMP
jgi:parallel beta-helix repeat protein